MLILDFSHVCFVGFGFQKTDFASVSWLRSCTFFSAFVLFFIWISPKFGFEVVTHASPHRTNFTFSSWVLSFPWKCFGNIASSIKRFHSRPMCFGSIVMIQICDSSHMNISIFCFAFWQSTVFPGRPTQLSYWHNTKTARYVLINRGRRCR